MTQPTPWPETSSPDRPGKPSSRPRPTPPAVPRDKPGWAVMVGTPAGRHVYRLRPGPEMPTEAVLGRIRAELRIPQGSGLDDDGWEISIVSAPVHPATLDTCTVHDWR